MRAGTLHCRQALYIALLGVCSAATAQNVDVAGTVELVNEDGHAIADRSNVAVWLTPLSGVQDDHTDTPPRAQPFALLQKRKTFSPHLLVVPVGAAVEFPNQDQIFHNVFSLFEGKRFDLGLYEAGSSRTIHFDRPGISYIFCNIHPEMGAVVITLRTPYYAISDEHGKIVIPDVPPGRYRLQVWQETTPADVLAGLRREVHVAADEHWLGSIRLKLPHSQALAHKNKYGQDYPKPEPPGGLYEQR